MLNKPFFTHYALQVIADVFGLPVFTFESTSGAALGAAYRAKHGLRTLHVIQSVIVSVSPSPPPSPQVPTLVQDIS